MLLKLTEQLADPESGAESRLELLAQIREMLLGQAAYASTIPALAGP